ncbi:transposable element Tcb1 transposase [Trichonephila clavipes]|nr:transposable element Tcb1 transposase [Trichonephila clavipes]
MLNGCVMHRNTGPAPPHWYYGSVGIGCHSRTPLVRIYGTLNSQSYISWVLEPVVLPYLQIELFPWPTRSPNLLPIENMWSMVTQGLTQITPPDATLDQLCQRVEAV